MTSVHDSIPLGKPMTGTGFHVLPPAAGSRTTSDPVAFVESSPVTGNLKSEMSRPFKGIGARFRGFQKQTLGTPPGKFNFLFRVPPNYSEDGTALQINGLRPAFDQNFGGTSYAGVLGSALGEKMYIKNEDSDLVGLVDSSALYYLYLFGIAMNRTQAMGARIQMNDPLGVTTVDKVNYWDILLNLKAKSLSIQWDFLSPQTVYGITAAYSGGINAEFGASYGPAGEEQFYVVARQLGSRPYVRARDVYAWGLWVPGTELSTISTPAYGGNLYPSRAMLNLEENTAELTADAVPASIGTTVPAGFGNPFPNDPLTGGIAYGAVDTLHQEADLDFEFSTGPATAYFVGISRTRKPFDILKETS